MSGKSVLFFLQRCVSVRRLTFATAIKTSSSVPPVRFGCSFLQQRTGTALRSSQHFCTKTGAPCEDDYPPLPAYDPDSDPETKEVYIVQVKGLPWSCSTQDLLQFFSECRIHNGEQGIHLTVNRQGKPSGRAFIELENEEDVSKALEKHRQYLGPRYVEVSEVTNCDAEDILKKAAHRPGDEGVVRIRGVPFSCTEDDIVHFFSGLDVVQAGVTMVRDASGRSSGEAFVRFSSQEEADRALQKDRAMMGHRYIEVFPSRSEEIRSGRRNSFSQTSFQATNRRPAPQNQYRPVTHQNPDAPIHYIHMRGLPFQVSGEEIVKFFSPLIVSKILIECGPNGRPSGEADVYFSCHREAVAAMSRDRMNIGNRYIELFLNSAPDCP
ncbi:G-rich sequence factor 1 [Cololabis saira]|uniref:G-rich sequence factor 1 n=1 Tax=Cololabis saira TaxID=129043 RepID=UPI002AD2EC71|nr:G-rich sequence factor 1 [Cololabis saira]